MTDEQHLLTILAEEAAEIAQQASKAIRFGIDHHRPGTDKSNRDLLEEEFSDLVAVAQLLNLSTLPYYVATKKEKVEAMMKISKQLGEL